MPAEFPNLSTGLEIQRLGPQPGQGAQERARRAVKQGDEQAIRKASQDFEAIFVNLLLKEMRKAIPKGGVFKQSMAREWFEGMLDEAVAKEVSQGPGIGLAGPIFEQMRRTAAKVSQPPAAVPPAPKTEEKKP